jgi:hypothetical protein
VSVSRIGSTPRTAYLASIVTFAVATAVSSLAHGSEPSEQGKVAFERAESAREERRFADALAAYREAMDAEPAASFTTLARTRAAYLERHSEGAFGPLSRLEEVRSSPDKLGDASAIEALEREVEGFPDGFVRSEARVVMAEAWWRRLGAPRRAAGLLVRVLDDASAERPTRAVALTELVAVERELGDLEAARRAAVQYADLAPHLAAEVARHARRVRLRWVASGSLALLAALGLAAFAAGARRRGVRAAALLVLRPSSVAFSLYLGAAAALIAHAYGADGRPFLLLGLGVLGAQAIARAFWLGARPGAAGRVARALACATAVLVIGFLALERTDPSYLEPLGL